MRSVGRIAITTALLVPLVAVPAEGQRYRWDLGVNGGYSWYSPMLDADAMGFTGTTTVDDVSFKPGGLLGAQLGFWLTPRIGLRANMTYADRGVESDNVRPLTSIGTDTDVNYIDHVNLWSGTGDLMIRFREPNIDWQGTETLPYLALGLGAKWFNPAGDNVTCTDGTGGDGWQCQPFRVGDPAVLGSAFALREQSTIMGLVGLGADVRFSPMVALRLEVNDRIYKPPVYAATPTATGATWTTAGDRVAKVVHEVGAQAGLHLLFGMSRPQVVTVVPQPLPQPEPAPVVVTPPPPREEAVTVCVVDPTATNGLRVQNAIFLPETGDTMVVVNGERVAFRNNVGTVMLARDADWYIRGQPLVMTVGTNKIEYLTYQGARQIDAGQLSFLGTINGYPVYADRGEVADIVVPLETLRAERPNTDLGVLLADRRELRTRVEGVKFLYVPLESTGCVFQTVQVMEQVRKGK